LDLQFGMLLAAAVMIIDGVKVSEVQTGGPFN
jgi:hypothetical protein